MTEPDRSDALYREVDGGTPTRREIERENKGARDRTEAREVELCPERPFPALSACLLPVGHDGPHVLARGRGTTISFYEPTRRGASFTCVKEATVEEPVTRARLAYLWPAIRAVDTSDFAPKGMDKS